MLHNIVAGSKSSELFDILSEVYIRQIREETSYDKNVESYLVNVFLNSNIFKK